MTDEEENDAVSNDKPRNSLPSDSIRVAPDVPGVSPLKHSHHSLLHDTGIGDQWVEYNRNLGSNCDFRASTTSKRPFLEPLNDISTSPSRHTYGEASPSSASVRTPRKDNMGIYLTRVATGLRSTVKHAFRWRKRPPGPRDVRPSVRAFYYKLLNASRPALACFLATGVSMVYPWSHKVTWFSITLSISGVGRNLGHTLAGIRQQWMGITVAVPLCFLLKFLEFSKVLTAIAIFLVSVAVCGSDMLNEAAKQVSLIFITWVVLVALVTPDTTMEDLLLDLIKAVLGANIFCTVVMLFPSPRLAVRLCRWRLEELQEVLGRFLEDAVDSYCLQDDSGLHDLEAVIDEAVSLIETIRALLPDVGFELALLSCGCQRSASRRTYDHVVEYLGILEDQLENCRGMAVALSDMYPNATHSEFVRAMRPGLLDVVTESKKVLEGTCYHLSATLQYWIQQKWWWRLCYRGRGPWRPPKTQSFVGRECATRTAQSSRGDGKHKHVSIHMEDAGKPQHGGLFSRRPNSSLYSEGGDHDHARAPNCAAEENTTMSLSGPISEQEREHLSRAPPSFYDIDPQCEDVEDCVPGELFSPPKAALARVLHALLKTRMRVVYGVELKGTAPDDRIEPVHGLPSKMRQDDLRVLSIDRLAMRSPRSVVLERSRTAAVAAASFQKDSERRGYMNLLPRNAFVLDLKMFVAAFERHRVLCNVSMVAVEPSATSTREQKTCCSLATSVFVNAYRNICRGPGEGWDAWRQPLKVALAILLASIVVLADDKHLGLQTIWCPITVAQTMSSHPSSAFKSGANRVQGTVLGAVMGMAVTTWAPVVNKVAIVFILTAWVFVCAFSRGSRTYGEAATSAGLTAPIIVIGPVVGSSGAVVRISQVILGTVIYVGVDNLIFPTRAKILLRSQLCESVEKLGNLCRDGLAIFQTEIALGSRNNDEQNENRGDTVEQPNASPARNKIVGTFDDGGGTGIVTEADEEPQTSLTFKNDETPEFTILEMVKRSALFRFVGWGKGKNGKKIHKTPKPVKMTETHTSPPTPAVETSAHLMAVVQAAEARMRRNTLIIQQALSKEELYISYASDEPELWHKPFQRMAYLKVYAIQLRMHKYLLMLHRSAASFPRTLARCDLEMLQAYGSIILRLQRTLEAVFNDVLLRLRRLAKKSSSTDASTQSMENLSSPIMKQGGVNVFRLRQEFCDIQDAIDDLVADYFAKDPVLTSLDFIVPLNGMIYSTRKMSPECVAFVQAVRELKFQEKRIGRGVPMAAAVMKEMALPVFGTEKIGNEGEGEKTKEQMD